jgi:hypothetical protein
MRRMLFALTVAMLVLGLAAAGTGAQAPNAGTNDYSSGFGFLDDPQTRGSVGYELIGRVPGGAGVSPAQGEFDFRRSSNGRGFHANGFCINATGNKAAISVRVTRSTDPAYVVGQFVEGLALDNGDGRLDRFHLDESSQPATGNADDCLEDNNENPSPIRGNIVVRDGGAAASP